MEDIPCSIEASLRIIGNKWAFLVLRELYEGTRRFNELARLINGISPTALTASLRHLEQEEMITRTVFPTVPATVEYALTEKGQSFHVVLKAMKKWGKEWAQ
ncbi:winged helix-turn-helix transcriptional regulator [Paenibacillus gorillae]|uniref:winged helix-turn-helix transcriptional regulator n=1 Tax=Paenibacillus gorillae TaxID=1243662 RepID=UPI0004BA419D|nr:helix-turn-helix domain-containing protein [Paenibacillus gorillae]